MANNLEAAIPKILAMGMMALRENTIMPRLINTDYQGKAAQKGNTIDVVIPSAVPANAVVPGVAAPAGTDLEPTTVPISLNNWFDASFSVTDKELAEVEAGILPMQISEAVKSLANEVDRSILALYKKVYGVAGTPGVTPFLDSTFEATEARKILNRQLCPPQDRRIVLDVEADANATGLSTFQNVNQAGSDSVMRDGNIGRKLGFDWYMNQNVLTHTKGTAASYQVNQASHAVGSKAVTVDTGTGIPAIGDVFTVAGDTQTYVVTGSTGTPNITAIQYEPAAKTAFADDAAITFLDSHVANLAFNRFAFALASRPLLDVDPLSSRMMSMSDPISQLTMRLEVSRLYKQTRWSFDILWGVGCPRPELAVRIAG
jgi:hypothetical protein